MTTAPRPRPSQQDRLPDLPLILEDLLVEIEQSRRDGATPAELADLRAQYNELRRQ